VHSFGKPQGAKPVDGGQQGWPVPAQESEQKPLEQKKVVPLQATPVVEGQHSWPIPPQATQVLLPLQKLLPVQH
jgi:hypothetical protein